MMFHEKFPTFNKWCQIQRAGAPEFYKPHVLVNNANGGQIELIIRDVNDFFTFISWNAIKIFDAGGLEVKWAVPEKHIINFYGLQDTNIF